MNSAALLDYLKYRISAGGEAIASTTGGDEQGSLILAAVRPIIWGSTMQRHAETNLKRGQSPPQAGGPHRNGHDRSLNADLVQATAGIIAKCRDPARVLEFYYWSRQDGLADLIRSFLGLSIETRKALETFLREASNPRQIRTRTEEHGQLALFPPRAARELKAGKAMCR